MDANGSNQTQLTTTPRFEYFPAWSPDGTTIAYTQGVLHPHGNITLEIFTMDAGGGGEIRLTLNRHDDYKPNWSPDGKKLVFTRDRGNQMLFERSAEIWMMNADGKRQVRLTKNKVEDSEAVFSPDGTRIAFTTARKGKLSIYVVKADGSAKQRLTKPAENYNPDWGVAAPPAS
ncbi:MAG: LpqB family beta-propeller domain-containing protein [Chloroflexota bacterium]|nr:LpqB family beta-propeller domain-containing protein [Chloroflexota bacterium]